MQQAKLRNKSYNFRIVKGVEVDNQVTRQKHQVVMGEVRDAVLIVQDKINNCTMVWSKRYPKKALLQNPLHSNTKEFMIVS